ncbi:MAG: hypothetical protein HDR04_13375 [Lachnospiraceae bacterium]|nr:hypothetical protein [Lachnospiraceae bacterium]
MEDKRELVIKRGEEFKISIKDKIETTDLFFDQYVSAAKMLDDIVSTVDDDCDKWEKSEFENNIIAFCGERGEGKSSAMISFTKAVYEHSNDDKALIFADCKNIKNTYFVEPIVIDPSMLDDVHNVLDIILATLYKKFQDQYNGDNQSVHDYEREKLLDQFQKVYKCVSLINNQMKMLDDEYDYEGNIGKLSKLGQSTGLKKELHNLIKRYIEIMSDAQKKNGKSGCLLIAIDDLDLCNSYAYKIAEQIRKYLIIPNVAIVMALKLEQLQLCVSEKNHKDYNRMLWVKQEIPDIIEEITNMSERYVAKLVPKSRRNYLPNVHMMHNVKLIYRDRNATDILSMESVFSFDEILLNLIYQKTGMKFLPDKTGKNFFLPDNLRDTVNIVALLSDMEEPKKKNSVYYENILRFFNYYERQWLFSNLSLEDYKGIQKLIHAKEQLHEKSAFLLRKHYELTEEKISSGSAQFFSETSDSFFMVMGWLKIYHTNVFGEELRKYAYVFQVLYTIRLNELLRNEKYNELTDFMGGYIFGGNFHNVLPYVLNTSIDRSRFVLPTVRVFNIIAEELYPDRNILLPESQNMQYYVKEISANDKMRKEKIVTWTLLGMLSNTWFRNESYQLIYTYNTQKIVFTNYSLLQFVHVSIENYIVSLCNPESIYKKVNMEYLGISPEEFHAVVEEILMFNDNVIEVFRRITVNTDIAMELIEYCSKKRDIKDRGVKDELERNQVAVDIFFKNARDFAKEYLEMKSDDMGSLKLAYDNDKKEIAISRIYALLIEAATQGNEPNALTSHDEQKREEMVRAFASKLRDQVEKVPEIENVSRYLINKTAENAERNMSRLASNIQRYYSLHEEEILEEAEVLELCSFYGKIVDIFLENPQNEISEELNREYKLVIKKYLIACQ